MVVCKTGWVGEGVVLHVSTCSTEHSIVNTDNVNADSNNRYLVLNGHLIHQIHPSSLVEIGPVVLEKKNLISIFTKNALCLVWLNWPNGSEKEDENVKKLTGG